MKNYYLGIDSGGTSDDILAVDPEGKMIFKSSLDAFHLNIAGIEKYSQHISESLKSNLSAKKYKITNCQGICIGVSGARHRKDRTKLKKILVNQLGIKNLIVETDTEIARYGAFEGEDGILLICGTGSILYGKVKNKIYRVGGWGKILGDEGSGYKIGLDALKILVKEYDLKKFNSRIAKYLFTKFSFTNENIINKIYRDNFNIQAIAPLVVELAKKKNKECLEILMNASAELCKLINIFFKLSKEKKVNLVLSGSLIEKNKFFSNILKKEMIRNFGKRLNIISKKQSPEYGAYLIAKNKF